LCKRAATEKNNLEALNIENSDPRNVVAIPSQSHCFEFISLFYEVRENNKKSFGGLYG
jgi:hypothetical protein